MATAAAAAAASSSASPASRIVHPSVISVAGAARGVEFSTWAYLDCEENDEYHDDEEYERDDDMNNDDDEQNQQRQPWLVTAAASNITIYKWNARARRLECIDRISVSGTVCFLERLPTPSSSSSSSSSWHGRSDALVVGWAGSARLSLVTYHRSRRQLQVQALVDLTEWQALMTVQDAQYALTTTSSSNNSNNNNSKEATIAVILDGGSHVALISLQYVVTTTTTTAGAAVGGGGWRVTTIPQPFALPLYELAARLPTTKPDHVATVALAQGALQNAAAAAAAGGTGAVGDNTINNATNAINNNNSSSSNNNNPNAASVLNAHLSLSPLSTGWGDIWSAVFLHGVDRVDAVLCLLHAPAGRVDSTRLGPPGRTTIPPTLVTCLAVHAPQGRAAWLWSTVVPADALLLHANGDMTWSSNGLVVQCVNSIVRIAPDGTIVQHVAVNGWATTTTTTTTTITTNVTSSSQTAGTTATTGADQTNNSSNSNNNNNTNHHSKNAPLTVNPALPLAIALDGATWTWWCSHTRATVKGTTTTTSTMASLYLALVVLRSGHVYVWQPLPRATENKNKYSNHNTFDLTNKNNNNNNSQQKQLWTLVPTGHQLDRMGEVAHASRVVWNCPPRQLFAQEKTTIVPQSLAGLWLVGSRLGDSHVVAITGLPLWANNLGNNEDDDDENIDKEKIASLCSWNQVVPWTGAIKKEDPDKLMPVKVESEDRTTTITPKQSSTTTTSSATDAYEAMLQAEEDALYHVIQPDENSGTPASDHENDIHQPNFKRQKDAASLALKQFPWLRLQTLRVMDTLVHLGPMGPSTQGPISAVAPCLQRDSSAMDPPISVEDGSSNRITPTTAHVVPVGFGNSGGIAYATLPGKDDRLLLAEEDLMGVQAIFSLPRLGIVLLAMEINKKNVATGDDKPPLPSVRILQVGQDDSLTEIHSTSTSAWSLALPWIAAGQKQLLHAHECSNNNFVLFTHDVVQQQDAYEYCVLRMGASNNVNEAELTVLSQGKISSMGKLKRVAAFSPLCIPGDAYYTSLVWDQGQTMVWTVNASGSVFFCTVDSTETDAMQIEETNPNDSEEQIDEDDEARALREFYATTKIVAADVFSAPRYLFDQPGKNLVEQSSSDSESVEHPEIPSDFDEDDLELYGIMPPKSKKQNGPTSEKPARDDTLVPFVAICRQSGKLEIYSLDGKGKVSTMVWSCHGAGQGLQVLGETLPSDRLARSHKIQVKEMKFFMCGPTLGADKASDARVPLRAFCLAIETSAGDFFLYTCLKRRNDALFIRQHFGTVGRTSLEQGRHRTKLSRKGIIAKNASTLLSTFEYNSLLTFKGISGQDGMLAMLPRPFWLISERGFPSILFHRCRHSAPAGGKYKIMNGFCGVGSGRFLTLHERVGRVGSQRLTLSKGISKVLQSQGFLGGDGLCFERITLGVTVRQIEFIEDPTISTSDHPLYALMVSREMEVDQSELNDDGLTPQEREQAKKEKEEAKIKRQVEADLGGFDFEHEWVEEITREDVFHVEQDLGGAPPIFKEAYSIWVVDAANSWQVVDSFDLDEYEHGMTLKVMHLSNFKEEPGRSNVDDEEEIIPEELDQTLFVMVGTGTVDHNGEDITGKGRALLFEVKRLSSASRRNTALVASLQLVYEKEIFHGPVTTLACLSAEGKNRLILGAGADVNVEQWGNNKLTQVGFFRATMQIADIKIFKNFLLLSDAYDSLHLLVYRESDKSLTLLAKEYEPVAVYAAGLLSRGPSITFLCHDDRQNVQFLQYAPGEAAARGGNKLVCRADYHLGTQTISFDNHFCRNSLLIHSATPTSTLAALQQQDTYVGHSDDDQRIAVHFGTTDGTVYSVVPLSQPVFWRMVALQSVLANALEPDCGLSPRAWRLYRRCARRGGSRSNDRKKSVIDGDLVCRYSDLPIRDQEDLASAIGSTVDAIMDDLLELRCGSLMI